MREAPAPAIEAVGDVAELREKPPKPPLVVPKVISILRSPEMGVITKLERVLTVPMTFIVAGA